MSRYLLDSNILIGYARGADFARKADTTYQLTSPGTLVLTSIVNQAEVLALAEKGGWGGEKRQKFEQVLNNFTIIPIKSKRVVDAYTQIKAWTEGKLPPSNPNLPTPPKPAQRMGQQNDMWIAATAMASNATIITTDKDFDLLHNAGIVKRIFIEPK